MIKPSIIKRLEAVENSKSSAVNIVIFDGLPPIYLKVSKGIGTACKSELKQFASIKEAEQFVDDNFPGSSVIVLKCGNDISSAEFYSLGG